MVSEIREAFKRLKEQVDPVATQLALVEKLEIAKKSLVTHAGCAVLDIGSITTVRITSTSHASTDRPLVSAAAATSRLSTVRGGCRAAARPRAPRAARSVYAPDQVLLDLKTVPKAVVRAYPGRCP